MKVLLTNFHSDYGGGHDFYLLYLFKELNRFNDVFLSCPRTSRLNQLAKEIKKENVFDVNFPDKIREIKHIVKNLGKVISILRQGNFDLIHVNGSPDHKIITYAEILLGNRIPIIRTIHSSLLHTTNLFSKIRKRYFQNRAILVSDFQRQLMYKAGYKDGEFTVVHNGIDTDYFCPKPEHKKLRTKYNINENDIVFVSTAGTSLHKGWQLLVEAASRLDSNLKNRVKIIIAGVLPAKETVEAYVDKFDMRNHVLFTGLLKDTREIVSLADMGFVLSYGIETISYACREMMSMGKPVLVSDYAGLPENIDDGINGWIVKTYDVSSIFSKLNEILKNLDSLDRFSLSARRKAEKYFGLKKFIDETYTCYKSVLN